MGELLQPSRKLAGGARKGAAFVTQWPEVVLPAAIAAALLLSGCADVPAAQARQAAPTATATMAPNTPSLTPSSLSTPTPASTTTVPISPTATSTPVQPVAGGSPTQAAARRTPVTPLVKPPRTRPPIGLIIPRIAVNSKIIDVSTDYDANGTLVWQAPAFTVGHYSTSANPGEVGNIFLSGHISSRNSGSVFKRLPELKEGDALILVTQESYFLYRVRATKVVEPKEVSVMSHTGEPIVTLMTCVPDGVYTHRLIVIAEPVQ